MWACGEMKEVGIDMIVHTFFVIPVSELEKE